MMTTIWTFPLTLIGVRSPLDEEKAFAALDAAWSNAPEIVRERFRATILRTAKNPQDPAQT